MPESGLWPELLAALGAAYLAGSVPFGLILTRLTGAGDLRTIGSGNIGATNVLRTGRKGLAALTLLLDAGKGLVSVLVAAAWGPDAAIAAAFGALLGHLFPVWLKFRGGKGVATYIGALAGLSWPAALFFCAVWLAMAAVFRYSSLSALAATAFAPVFLALAGEVRLTVPSIVLGSLVFIRHAGNIRRLVSGEETRIGQK